MALNVYCYENLLNGLIILSGIKCCIYASKTFQILWDNDDNCIFQMETITVVWTLLNKNKIYRYLNLKTLLNSIQCFKVAMNIKVE